MYHFDMDFSLAQLLKNKTWKTTLKKEFTKTYFLLLEKKLSQDYKNKKTIYPIKENIFSGLNTLDLDKVKVVILGQDPYHGEGEAHGFSFSVPDNIKIPPSLRNIYKELENDLGLSPPLSGNLEHWAKQGVLLLNSVLTVEKDKAGSHQKYQWQNFTDAIISCVSDKNDHVVFILWGSYAQKKIDLIDQSKHLVIQSVHPSPLSSYRGFFGSKPFSRTNQWLALKKKPQILW